MKNIKEIKDFYDSLKVGDVFVNKQFQEKKITILEVLELDLNTFSCKVFVRNRMGYEEELSIYFLNRFYKKIDPET